MSKNAALQHGDGVLRGQRAIGNLRAHAAKASLRQEFGLLTIDTTRLETRTASPQRYDLRWRAV